jgi:hypothetical protein
MLLALPSNGRCLQSHRLATVLYATISWPCVAVTNRVVLLGVVDFTQQCTGSLPKGASDWQSTTESERDDCGKRTGFVRFVVLLAVTTDSSIFWDVTPCSVAEEAANSGTTRYIPGDSILHGHRYENLQHFCNYLGQLFNPKDGGDSTFLRNVGKLLPTYTASLLDDRTQSGLKWMSMDWSEVNQYMKTVT